MDKVSCCFLLFEGSNQMISQIVDLGRICVPLISFLRIGIFNDQIVFRPWVAIGVQIGALPCKASTVLKSGSKAALKAARAP